MQQMATLHAELNLNFRQTNTLSVQVCPLQYLGQSPTEDYFFFLNLETPAGVSARQAGFPGGIYQWAPPGPARDNVAAADPESGSLRVEIQEGSGSSRALQAGLVRRPLGSVSRGLAIPGILVALACDVQKSGQAPA